MRCDVNMIGFVVALILAMGISGCSNSDSDSATLDDPTELAAQVGQGEQRKAKITSTGSSITAEELMNLLGNLDAHVIEIDRVNFNCWLEITTVDGRSRKIPSNANGAEIRWREEERQENCRVIIYWKYQYDKTGQRYGSLGFKVQGGTYSFGVPPDDLWFGWKSWNSIGSIPNDKALQVGKPNTVFEYQFAQRNETGEPDEDSTINMKLIVVPLASAQANK